MISRDLLSGPGFHPPGASADRIKATHLAWLAMRLTVSECSLGVEGGQILAGIRSIKQVLSVLQNYPEGYC
jgi:hypothetical protein